MGTKRNRKRLVAAAIAIVGLAGGAVAAQAATFASRYVAAGTDGPPSFLTIAPTTCISGAGTAADPCLLDLEAGTGNVNIEDAVNGPQTVPFFGFGVNGATDSLAGSSNSTIKVAQGTVMKITLTQNGVTDPIDLSFPSLPASSVSHVGNVYTVVASQVGTSVFQPGSNPDAPKQVAMGLVGVLIVTPTGCASATLSCAYVQTSDNTVPSYSEEVLVATTDLDPAFAADPGSFDMGYFGQAHEANGSPRKVYHLVNGESFPATEVIDVRAGDSVLVRSINAGVSDKSMSLLGLRQLLLARNASPYADPQTLIAPLVGPGETADLVVQIPLGAPANQRYALIDAGRQMNHGNDYGFGGALTFFNVWPAGTQALAFLPAAVDVGATTTTVADATTTSILDGTSGNQGSPSAPSGTPPSGDGSSTNQGGSTTGGPTTTTGTTTTAGNGTSGGSGSSAAQGFSTPAGP